MKRLAKDWARARMLVGVNPWVSRDYLAEYEWDILAFADTTSSEMTKIGRHDVHVCPNPLKTVRELVAAKVLDTSLDCSAAWALPVRYGACLACSSA